MDGAAGGVAGEQQGQPGGNRGQRERRARQWGAHARDGIMGWPRAGRPPVGRAAGFHGSSMLQAVTFDVTNTLLHCPRLGEIYSEVLARHGIAVAPGEARRLIRRVWQEMACAAEPGRDRFTSHPEGERGWWRRFLTRFCEHLGSAPPSPFAAAELFHRFAQGASWEVYPEVPAVLDRLRARGLRLGVASNWDHRLPALLGDLGLRRRFDAVVYS